MESALPAFQCAADLGPSPSEAEQLRDLCSRQAAQIEQLREAAEQPAPQQASPVQAGTIKPEERHALIQLLSDLREQAKEQSKDIERLKKENADLKKSMQEAQQDITWIQESFPPQIAEDRRRLTALEEGWPVSSDSGTAAMAHVSALFEHMEAMGRKQVSFREASKCLHISKSRALQLKPLIAVDERFILVHSESHKQKELIRLRKYFI